MDTLTVVSKEACTSCVATWTTLTVDRDSDSDSYLSCSETKSWKEGCHYSIEVRVSYHRAVLGLAGLYLRQFLLILVWTGTNLEP